MGSSTYYILKEIGDGGEAVEEKLPLRHVEGKGLEREMKIRGKRELEAM